MNCMAPCLTSFSMKTSPPYMGTVGKSLGPPSLFRVHMGGMRLGAKCAQKCPRSPGPVIRPKVVVKVPAEMPFNANIMLYTAELVFWIFQH